MKIEARTGRISILPADSVAIELSPYDLSRARIVFQAKWVAG